MARYRSDGLLKTETFMRKLLVPDTLFKTMIYYRDINGLVACGAIVRVKMANDDLLIHEEKFMEWLERTQRDA